MWAMMKETRKSPYSQRVDSGFIADGGKCEALSQRIVAGPVWILSCSAGTTVGSRFKKGNEKGKSSVV